jgi:hypothetical protein
VHHDGPLPRAIVDACLQSVRPQQVAVLPDT